MKTDDSRISNIEFDKWAEGYDRSVLQIFMFKPAHDSILEYIRGHVNTNKVVILDIGCGTGVFPHRVRKHMPGNTIFGLDLSAEMVKCAHIKRIKGENDDKEISFLVGDSGMLPYSDNSFDFITCSNSFHHYPDPHVVVKEMHRVLKDNGKLLIVDGDKDKIIGRFIYDLVVSSIEQNVYHYHSEQFKHLFYSSGFKRVHQRRINRGLPLLLTVGTADKSLREL